MIREMVLENFKSYAGTQHVGPFHKVRCCVACWCVEGGSCCRQLLHDGNRERGGGLPRQQPDPDVALPLRPTQPNMPQCFSAVVGPNGSGKSNVIDAMLFVFGRRAKQVRVCAG